MLQDWHANAQKLKPETRLLIDGKWIEAGDGGSFASINPANGAHVADLSAATEADVAKATEIAKQRFDQGAWSNRPLRDRVATLYRFAKLVEENAATFALLDSIEMGKPISEMLNIDVPGSVLTLKFMAECVDKIGGTCPTTNSDALHYIMRQPLGVVGAITPWNYPMMMATWKIAPALAAGNSVVLKPSEDASLSSLLLGKLFLEAGGPEGVLNVIPGRGAVAGQALARSMQVDKIAFTGSTGVGRLMHEYAAQSNLKRVSAELGGKSPQIILEDVQDLDAVATKVARGLFGNQGEVCSAGTRILVARPIYDNFCQALAKAAPLYEPGDPLDPATIMGPLVNKPHQQKVLGFIDGAVAEGHTQVVGGAAHEAGDAGCYVSPTLFAGLDNTARIAREEIFGPVGCVIPHDGPDDAVRIANDSPYGLAAGIWTNNLTATHQIARDLECGMVWVNGYMNGDMTQPWGGWKESGEGRDKCLDALLENTQTKSVWVTLES
ncbi:Aldehyde dehydrogenase PuuC [Roseovarius albus]|uniref:Aldehyde dehydrogenase PuuC n=1 Tax=Roseovarius albus TaxID=1247867 RepID=A0A1X6Y749_9RHOB|nr:aldehyde dehydrogenase family protein [Roseovarius albus]SLN12338.1 Aldehyde dehydrogenase PuuC [Roseovarius albus]